MDFVVRREGRRRTEPLAWTSSSARKLSIFRRLAAHNKKAINTLWGATPRIRRRSGSSTASRAPSLMKAFVPSTELRRVP